MTALALFALAVGGVAVTAAAAAAALRVASPVSFALAAYLFGAGEVVLLTEVLSPPRLANRAGYLAGEAALLGAALAAWHLRGRPRPPLPRTSRGALRRHPLLLGLAAAVAAAFAYAALVVLTTPPNNGDSMNQHLARAAAWLQHGGVYWIRDVHTERENEWLPAAEMEVLYTFVFLRRDTVAAATQLLAYAALVVAVAGMARRLGFARPAAAFAGLLVATLPQVALQSVTTQVDLVVASFVAAAAYFVRALEPADLPLGALALGLALGTKATAILALPLLLALAVASLPRRRLAAALAWAAAGFVALGAFGYVMNTVHTGHPLGTGEPARGYRARVTVRGTVSSLGKLAFRLVDFPGYHLPEEVRSPVNRAAEEAFDLTGVPLAPLESTTGPVELDVNISVHEDISWFGPLGFLLVAPLSAVFLYRAARRRAAAAAAVHAAAFPGYALLLVLVYKDGPWHGRYLMTAVALTMPLAATAYRHRRLAAAVAAVAVVTLALTHAFNTMKPTGLDGRPSIWSLTRSEAQALELPGYERVIDAVDATVPERARLGIVMEEQDYDYPFYGERLERRLVPLPRAGALAAAERRGVRWVLIGRELEPPPPRRGWSRQRFSSYGTLLARSGAPA